MIRHDYFSINILLNPAELGVYEADARVFVRHEGPVYPDIRTAMRGTFGPTFLDHATVTQQSKLLFYFKLELKLKKSWE